MDRFTAMTTFVRVVELGSLSAAARELGLTQPAVSQQVAGLERRLGMRLVNRTTRRLGLTEAGETFYGHAKRILEELCEAEDVVSCLAGTLGGNLRIQAPVGFGQMHLAPIVVEFQKRHPDLTVELLLDDRFTDLIEEGVNVALRFGSLKPSGLIVRRLGVMSRVLVASPDYVAMHGSPETPEELADHAHVRFSWSAGGEDLPLIGPEGPVTVPVRSRFLANNAHVLMAALCGGLGVGAAQTCIVQDCFAQGKLVRVMRNYAYEPLPMHVVYPPGRFIPRKVRVFVDHLVAALPSVAGLDRDARSLSRSEDFLQPST